MIDLSPVTEELGRLVRAVPDTALDAPTPCSGMTVGDLLDHIDGLSLAFTAAARKTAVDGGGGPSADASRLGADWRTRVPARLTELAGAWRDESAWCGMAEVGGGTMPAEVAGIVAVNEVIVHGWDIAVATRQAFDPEPAAVEVAHGFVAASAEQNPDGTPGLFGPPVAVPADAPLFDRLIGLSGRDPAWRPPAT